MEVITLLDNYNIDNYQTGIALGNFDGVHIGHQALIVNLVEACKKNNLKSVIYTFKSHPRKITTENGSPKKILADAQKFKILAEMGIDKLIFIDFDDYQRTLNPHDFIKDILVDKLKMAYAVVGFDYRFGFQAEGDTELLKNLQNQYSYKATIIEPVMIQNETISSTGIRKFISEGNISKANLFLGRPFTLIGKVIKGKGLGKKFGFPTANLQLKNDVAFPTSGVYYTKCIYNNQIFYGVTNIGVNPTIGSDSTAIETHIFNFNQDIYDSEIEILFYHKIRDEIKFSSIEALIKQVDSDMNKTKKFFGIL